MRQYRRRVIVRIMGVLDRMKLKFLEKDVGCGEVACSCCFICGVFEVVIGKHKRISSSSSNNEDCIWFNLQDPIGLEMIDVPWIRYFSLQSSGLLCVEDNLVNAVERYRWRCWEVVVSEIVRWQRGSAAALRLGDAAEDVVCGNHPGASDRF